MRKALLLLLAGACLAHAEPGCDTHGNKLMEYLNNCLGEVPVTLSHGVNFPILPAGQGVNAPNYCYNSLIQTADVAGSWHVNVCQLTTSDGERSADLRQFSYTVAQNHSADPNAPSARPACLAQAHGQSFLYGREGSEKAVAMILDFSGFHCTRVAKPLANDGRIHAESEAQENNCTSLPALQTTDAADCDGAKTVPNAIADCDGMLISVISDLHQAVVAQAKAVHASHRAGNFGYCARTYLEALAQLPAKVRAKGILTGSEQKLVQSVAPRPASSSQAISPADSSK